MCACSTPVRASCVMFRVWLAAHLPRARMSSSSEALGSSLLTHSVIQREYASLRQLTRESNTG